MKPACSPATAICVQQPSCAWRHDPAGKQQEAGVENDLLGAGASHRHQLVKGLVEGQKVCHGHFGLTSCDVPANPAAVAAVLGPLLAASVVDQDAAHRFRRCSEEVSAVVPVRLLFPGLARRARHQPQIRFVNQGGGLQRLPARLARRLPRRQAP
jgi:hypothetical protein